jgi:hypothetical protein
MRNARSSLLTALFAALAPLGAQDNLLASADNWRFVGAQGEVDASSGEPVLRVVGRAHLRQMDFRDGTIEFEIRLTELPSFAGFYLRTDATEANSENIYLRAHKSNEWDALQYQPLLNGTSTWQLYTDEGFSTAAPLPSGEWIPVRIAVAGDRGDLVVGRGATAPTMRIRFESSSGAGGVALHASFRGPIGEGRAAAEFRRLKISHQRPQLSAAAPRSAPEPGFIRTWSVSAPVAAPAGAIATIPARTAPTRITADDRGVVNLSKHFTRVAGASRSIVVAEAVLTATEARSVRLAFDYSDDITIFLNGEKLFDGENGWESRYPFYLGVVRPTALNNQLALRLRPGANTLTVVIAERNFGWGFAARLEDGAALRVEAP